jgi:IclR family transcriptional regulator, KDG regulon repressor
MKRRASEKSQSHPDIVDVVLSVLISVASSEGSSEPEIASLLQANRRIVAQALRKLDRCGLVLKDPLNLYWVGPRLRQVTEASRGRELIAASSEVMDKLAKQLGGGIALLHRVEYELLLVAYRPAPDQSVIPALAASRGPLYEGGGAKLMLAYAPAEIVDDVLDKHLPEFIPSTLRSREAVLSLLEQIRADGFYVSIGELHPDAFTITAPIRDARRRVVAALGVQGHTSMLTASSQGTLIGAVVNGANHISKRLG